MQLPKTTALETYALNLSQAVHMVVTAAVVPYYIGLHSYGLFAAISATPGAIQSIFETSYISLLSSHRRRDIAITTIFLSLAACLLGLLVGFWIFFGAISILYTIMAASLFARSYAFSIAVVSGSMKTRLLQSEFGTLVVYLVVLGSAYFLGIADETVPVVMVSCASLFSALFILATSSGHLEPPTIALAPPVVRASTLLRAMLAKLFEDGFLTLPPLVLALSSSPSTAGQFRIFVSAVKAAYKFFPFRHEIVMREVMRSNIALRPLIQASVIFAVGAVGATVVLAPYDIAGPPWIALIGASGATVCCISLYPVASLLDFRVVFTCLIGLTGVLSAPLVADFRWFAVSFAVATWLILVAIILAIWRSPLTLKPRERLDQI